MLNIIILVLLSYVCFTNQQCGTPIECYSQVLELLKQDRSEMKQQRDFYKKQYDELKNEFNSKLEGIRNYVNQPWNYITPMQLLTSINLSTTLAAFPMTTLPKDAKKVLIYAKVHSGASTIDYEIELKIGTKVINGIGFQNLTFHPYTQNAWSYNSQVFEFDIINDSNLYVQTTVNVAQLTSLGITVELIAWKN